MPGSRARAAALRARDLGSTGTFASAPRSESSKERLHLGLDVGAAHRLLPARRAAPRAADVAEDPAEDVAEVAEVEVAEVDVRAAGARRRPRRCRAERSYCLALLLVGEDVVRSLHLLEALLRGLVAGVRVGVVLARELAVRLLDLVLRGAFFTPSVS